MSWNGDVFPITDPLWAESTGHHGFPSHRASNPDVWCFFVISFDKLLNKQPNYRWQYDVAVMLVWDGDNAILWHLKSHYKPAEAVFLEHDIYITELNIMTCLSWNDLIQQSGCYHTLKMHIISSWDITPVWHIIIRQRVCVLHYNVPCGV